MISVLALEKESVVRDSILAMIRGIELKKASPEAMLNCLNALVRASRTLVGREDLRNARMEHPLRPPKSDQAEAIARPIGEAISDLLRVGIRSRDLSGTYCVKCDLSGMDLAGTDFSNAILYLSNFEGSKLAGANFDAADVEHTRFANSDLEDAKLTHLDDRRPGAFQPSYVDRIFNRSRDKPQVAVYGPNFNCADLRGCRFQRPPNLQFFLTTRASSADVLC